MLLIYESVAADVALPALAALAALAPAGDAGAAEPVGAVEAAGAVVGSVDVAGIEVAVVEYEAGIDSPEPPPAVVDRVYGTGLAEAVEQAADGGYSE